MPWVFPHLGRRTTMHRERAAGIHGSEIGKASRRTTQGSLPHLLSALPRCCAMSGPIVGVAGCLWSRMAVFPFCQRPTGVFIYF